ncbi:hypothetical protein [Demequina activiva]|uniref:Uncharacterized protein n=1 Tax=Demequina activiva TaxID=1582364 RepID=A0A919Q0V1_9MICO|nr:hypothetical protein [Demequina activiva]GIG54240.1 hypothetical protein Dac01nite_09920 [Demequina activiva]
MSEKKSDSTEHATRAPRTDTSRMKVIAIVTIVALALGLFGGWAIAALSQPDAEGDVWVIGARGSQTSVNEIVLTDPTATVVGVTFDGERQATDAPISKVVQEWDDVFGDTTPRAILVGTSAAGSHSVVVTLGRPEATADTLTFPATPVGGSEIPEFTAGDSTLLIDGAGVLEAGDLESLTALGG